MNLVVFIKARKVIFVRTILQMEECIPVRKIFIERFREYHDGWGNPYDSPVIQILHYCMEFGVIISKEGWRKLIWEKAWSIEDNIWCDITIVHNKMDLINVSGQTNVLGVVDASRQAPKLHEGM